MLRSSRTFISARGPYSTRTAGYRRSFFDHTLHHQGPTQQAASKRLTESTSVTLKICTALPTVSISFHRTMATMKQPQHFMMTSGETDPVWIHTEPYSKRPHFSKLAEDTTADVCIIGAGISGITIAYELVKRGVNVVMLEAREVLSGESGSSTLLLAILGPY